MSRKAVVVVSGGFELIVGQTTVDVAETTEMQMVRRAGGVMLSSSETTGPLD